MSRVCSVAVAPNYNSDASGCAAVIGTAIGGGVSGCAAFNGGRINGGIMLFGVRLTGEESYEELRRSHMQYIHLGVIQIRLQVLHRIEQGNLAVLVLRDTRWTGDQATFASMEVDLTRGIQMVYIVPNTMMTIGDFYNHVQARTALQQLLQIQQLKLEAFARAATNDNQYGDKLPEVHQQTCELKEIDKSGKSIG